MTDQLKALGLTLMVVCAISAVNAGSASAATEAWFHSESAPTVVTGFDDEQQHSFSVGPAAVMCSEVISRGTLTEETMTSLTIEATYDGCTFGVNPATVNMNGCDYLLTAHTQGTAPNNHNIIHLKCPAGKKIKIEIPAIKCDLEVGEQTASEGIKFTHGGSGSTTDLTLDITAKVTGTRVATAGAGALCNLIAETFTGVYKGSTTLNGYEDLCTSDGTDIHGNPFKIYKVGAQVGIWHTD